MRPFSIGLGGPLYEAYRRLRLVRPPIALTYRRVAAYICVTWLPLAVLSANAYAIRRSQKGSFLPVRRTGRAEAPPHTRAGRS